MTIDKRSQYAIETAFHFTNGAKRILYVGSSEYGLDLLYRNYLFSSIDSIIRFDDSAVDKPAKRNGQCIMRFKKMDLGTDEITIPYDLVFAHLSLGEASKWGEKLDSISLLVKLLSTNTQYIVIYDYKGRDTIDWDKVEAGIAGHRYSTVLKSEIKIEDPKESCGKTGLMYFLEKDTL